MIPVKHSSEMRGFFRWIRGSLFCCYFKCWLKPNIMGLTYPQGCRSPTNGVQSSKALVLIDPDKLQDPNDLGIPKGAVSHGVEHIRCGSWIFIPSVLNPLQNEEPCPQSSWLQ